MATTIQAAVGGAIMNETWESSDTVSGTKEERSAIIRRLVLGDVEGPLSAFKVFARASRLADKADEAMVAECVEAVLSTYGWTSKREDAFAAEVEAALGIKTEAA